MSQEEYDAAISLSPSTFSTTTKKSRTRKPTRKTTTRISTRTNAPTAETSTNEEASTIIEQVFERRADYHFLTHKVLASQATQIITTLNIVSRHGRWANFSVWLFRLSRLSSWSGGADCYDRRKRARNYARAAFLALIGVIYDDALLIVLTYFSACVQLKILYL